MTKNIRYAQYTTTNCKGKEDMPYKKQWTHHKQQMNLRFGNCGGKLIMATEQTLNTSNEEEQ